MDSRYVPVRDRVVAALRSFDEVLAVGVAGSQALGTSDEFSDLDLQVFVSDVPPAERRREAYARDEHITAGPLDHPVTAAFTTDTIAARVAVDWLTVDGLKCDVLWLPLEGLQRILSRLSDEPTERESAAVLVETVQPIHDPQGCIARLKRECPAYGESRAGARAAALLGHAHFFLCQWAVLHKCAAREDLVAYALAESEMVAALVDALYAVNRVWQNDRRRLAAQLERFEIVPDALLERLQAMLLRQGRCAALAACGEELLSLFRDLSALAQAAHPSWRLPGRWDVAV